MGEKQELDSFEKYLQEEAETVEEFIEWRKNNPNVEVAVFGVGSKYFPRMKELCDQFNLTIYNDAINQYAVSNSHTLLADAFTKVIDYFLKKGAHVLLLLPNQKLFSYKEDGITAREAHHIITKGLESHPTQIHLVNGLYSDFKLD
jgi:hypothetical protein